MSALKGIRKLARLNIASTRPKLLVHKGRRVFPEHPVQELPPLMVRTATDAAGFWGEWGFSSPEILTGSAEDGWTDPRGLAFLRLEATADLATWTPGVFSDCPGNPVEVGDQYEYWARATIPVWWTETLNDFSASSTRYGKSITGIHLLGSTISLPNFPYDMPSEAAALQADLRTAGYAGATVSSTSGTLVAKAINHLYPMDQYLVVTMSGSNVTDVKYLGTTISLAYPYSMPTQRAALQTALRSAGYSGAVVKLYADSWTVAIPDVLCSDGNIRPFYLDISPGDPFPDWDKFGLYLGILPDAIIQGSLSNTRDPYGSPLEERAKQFCRLRITPGTNSLIT